MSRLRPASLLLPLAIALVGTGAQAATLTLNDWTWGQGNMVGVKQPAYEGRAGGFSGVLSGSGVPGLDGTVQTYCVEIAQSFSFGVTYSDYVLVDAASYFGADAAEALVRLLGWVEDQRLFARADAGQRDDLSTALQLAIWNLRYDGDDSLSLGGFKSIGTAYAGALPGSHGYWGGNAMLQGSAGQAPRHTLWVLQSPTRQDQLLWQVNASVPEPASWALLGAAGIAAGVARRRRTGA